ncbi:TIGR02680 family protein [Streptoalloteichus hindustanus]|uniref:TIGR02680 family protein n=1 Tax=Streptoalloteichus hindustanus TaxID=2017 RepID=A0A1M5NN70_STRHI|nr:TIGR02680 family protein [Streptoalloteichus hindustanus]SHG90960.1 TIGR02680 family protein [Streptoalloteichus hindustanus]
MTTSVSPRWQLHRGGIVNVWQYAEQTFDFSGGRAIFQGTNGSGKSRTLELLLPLCLDGDLRQLGSKGFDTVSIRRLMLDDYDGGPNRIGYAWIELRRVGANGGAGGGTTGGVDEPDAEYLTCGIGVKASKTSQQITDSWRFVTAERVGVDLRLVGPDGVPLGPAQLRDALGADCVLEDAPFRAKIAETVYGVPAARYSDLLHLQRTLRNPDVGLKVLEGQLEQILTDALPPLDAGLVEQLATSFEDLESIRTNITRLTRADSALGAFLSSYRGYALAQLRAAGDRLTGARDSLASLRSDVDRQTQRLETARRQRAEADAEVAAMEATEGRLETRIDAVKSSPVYRDLRDLQDREQLVARSRTAAETALDAAARQRAQEDRSVDSVLAVLRRFAQDTGAADALAERGREQLAGAGLDASACPRPPAAPAADAAVLADEVRAKPDADADPLPIERRMPPAVDAAALLAALDAAADQAGRAVAAARQRAALTDALRHRAVELDRHRTRVEELHRGAREAQIAATEAAGRRNQAGQRLADAAAVWLEQCAGWLGVGPLAELPAADRPVLPTADELVATRTASRSARESVRQWATPHQRIAAQQLLAAEQTVNTARGAIAERDAELRALRGGVQSEPARPPFATAERDPGAGAPFYRLVDFADSLAEERRAGLEAALQASGLLTAWVTADGQVADPELADLLAVTAPAVAGPSLADVLTPAPEPGCPVPAEVVRGVLAAVALSDEPTGGLAVSTLGQWSAGVLTGAWRKDAAEYVGAGAREAARQRRISALEDELDVLRGELAAAQHEMEDARAVTTTWQRHLDAFPDDGDLIAAHATLASAREAAAEAERRSVTLREQHREAERRWTAASGELARDTAEAGLAADTAELERAHRAAEQARHSVEQLRDTLVERCAGTVADLTDAVNHHHAAVADRIEAETAADRACVEYAEQAAALTELTGAVGGEAQQVADQLAALEEQRRQLRRDLPAARERVASLREQVTKAETLLETRRGQLGGREDDALRAEEGFRATLTAPGVWAAAVGLATATDANTDSTQDPAGAGAGSEDADLAGPPLDDLDAALAAVAAAPDQRVASEGTVITKLQALQTALAGTHDIAAETYAGVLTVTVTGEEGPRPVAEAAHRVATRLAEQRGYLGERYQEIFATYLIRDLAERLRGQIAVAEDLCRRMNDVLERARSSQGVHVRLEWRPSAALDEGTRQALDLVRMPFAQRTSEQDDALRRVFTERIEAERDAHSAGYAEILARALDYRSWYSFTVRVRDTGPDGRPRDRRLRQLSSGETRLVSYVTLFAAAASFYDAVGASPAGEGAPEGGLAGPLRLVLLDEAFERLDDPTIARLLGLLVDLDMDWIITWPSGWGVSPKIPRMHIYDVLRPKTGRGIACTHTTWDGAGLDREDL